jgi:hypothetical protein
MKQHRLPSDVIGLSKVMPPLSRRGFMSTSGSCRGLYAKPPKSIYFWRISMRGRMNLMTLALHMNLDGLLPSQMIFGFSDLIGSFAAMRVTDPHTRY